MIDADAYNAKNVFASSPDGWRLGYIGIPWPGPWPKLNGDLFVADPDGWQAGIAWESSGPALIVIAGPSLARWGVFEVLFSLPVMSEHDLVSNFLQVLPLLKAERRRVSARATYDA